jgi:hypothetical protein
MLHWPGISGSVTSLVLPVVIFAICYLTRKFPVYELEPEGTPGAFELFLQKYLHFAEYLIGLATGSIVLLVGSSAFHGQGGRLPWFYASPLIILAASVVCGLMFMGWLILNYEEHKHGTPHTALRYSFSLTFGISLVVLFVVGYIWLIFVVTH